MAHPGPAIVNDLFAPRLALVYAALFLAAGWHLPLFPVWLAASGLDPAAIGMVLAASQIVRVVATPAATRLADRHGSLNRAIVVAALATVCALALLGTVSGFVPILVAAAVLGFMSAPLLPLIDAYGLKGLALRARAYGPVRLWGSVAFIVANLTGGLLLDALAPSDLIWLIFAGNCAVAAAAFMLVPLPRDEAPRRSAPRHNHLRQPAFLAIAAAVSLIQASHAVYYAFSTLDWSGKGFGGTTIGMLWALGVAAEIVLFALAPRLPASIGPVTLILIGAAGAIVRWTRDRVRSAACAARAAAVPARAVVRRDASRHDDVSEPECARGRPRRRARRHRDRQYADDGGGLRAVRTAVRRGRQPRLPGDDGACRRRRGLRADRDPPRESRRVEVFAIRPTVVSNTGS